MLRVGRLLVISLGVLLFPPPPAQVVAVPPTPQIGSVPVGSSSTVTLAFGNSGGSPTGALAVTVVGPDAARFQLVSDSCTNVVLPPSGQCTVDVSFAPQVAGDAFAEVRASAVPGGAASHSLQGTGTAVDLDSDDDGLTDAEEADLGTDPSDADTDGDELSDGDEVHVYATDPSDPDTDDGGVSDGVEVLEDETDPLDPFDDL